MQLRADVKRQQAKLKRTQAKLKVVEAETTRLNIATLWDKVRMTRANRLAESHDPGGTLEPDEWIEHLGS